MTNIYGETCSRLELGWFEIKYTCCAWLNFSYILCHKTIKTTASAPSYWYWKDFTKFCTQSHIGIFETLELRHVKLFNVTPSFQETFYTEQSPWKHLCRLPYKFNYKDGWLPLLPFQSLGMRWLIDLPLVRCNQPGGRPSCAAYLPCSCDGVKSVGCILFAPSRMAQKYCKIFKAWMVTFGSTVNGRQIFFFLCVVDRAL